MTCSCGDRLQINATQLETDLFGKNPRTAVLLVESEQCCVGFATYHQIYSTFLGKPGIWLDDLYIQEPHRYQGMGKAIFQQLRQILAAIGGARIDWTVAVSNLAGIEFYQRIGAEVKEELRLCRLEVG